MINNSSRSKNHFVKGGGNRTLILLNIKILRMGAEDCSCNSWVLSCSN